MFKTIKKLWNKVLDKNECAVCGTYEKGFLVFGMCKKCFANDIQEVPKRLYVQSVKEFEAKQPDSMFELGMDWCDICGLVTKPCSCDTCYEIAMKEITEKDLATNKEVMGLITIDTSVEPIVVKEPKKITIDLSWLSSEAFMQDLKDNRNYLSEWVTLPTLNGPVKVKIMLDPENITGGGVRTDKPEIIRLSPFCIFDPIGSIFLLLHEAQHAKDLQDKKFIHYSSTDYKLDPKVYMEIERPAMTNEIRWLGLPAELEDTIVDLNFMVTGLLHTWVGSDMMFTAHKAGELAIANIAERVDRLVLDFFDNTEVELTRLINRIDTPEVNHFLEVTGLGDLLAWGLDTVFDFIEEKEVLND